MAKPTLHHIEIYPGENGGHRVVHEFNRAPANQKGAIHGGMYMERPEPEEHLFGKAEGSKVLAHVANALGLKNEAKEEASEGEDDE